VRHTADVRTLLLATGLVCFLGRPYTQLMPAFARDVFNVGPEGLGVMLTMPSLGAILSAVCVGAVAKIDTTAWLIRCAVIAALALLGFALSPFYWLSLVLLFVCGAATTAATSLSMTMLQQVVDDRVRGRVLGYTMAVTWGGWRLGALPAGLLAGVIGTPLAVAVFAVLLLLTQWPLSRTALLRGGIARPVEHSQPST
jgi:MFS family permease